MQLFFLTNIDQTIVAYVGLEMRADTFGFFRQIVPELTIIALPKPNTRAANCVPKIATNARQMGA